MNGIILGIISLCILVIAWIPIIAYRKYVIKAKQKIRNFIPFFLAIILAIVIILLGINTEISDAILLIIFGQIGASLVLIAFFVLDICPIIYMERENKGRGIE